MIGNKVRGEGPLTSKIFLCGEAPGRQEAAEGRPFCGASGSELNWLYLRAAGLRREDLYTTNIVKWRTDEKDSDPTTKDIARDEPELLAEIQVIDPEIIVAVGRIATQWFMQTAKVDMEKLHGIPIRCPRYPEKTLIVCYHPAATLHQPERYLHLVYWDFVQLGKLVRGDIKPCDDLYTQPYYSAAETILWRSGSTVAVDTEGEATSPWGMSSSAKEGNAFVSKKPWPDIIKNCKVVFHNALYDLKVLEGLKVETPQSIEDTMLMAYLIPWFPKRLKALAFKLCNMELREFEELTYEASEEIAKNYLEKVLANKCKECGGKGVIHIPFKRQQELFRSLRCPVCRRDTPTWCRSIPQSILDCDGIVKIHKSKDLGRRVQRLLKRGTQLRAGWNAIDGTVRHDAEGQLGNMSEVTLDDVPFQDALHYSAMDADATLRVYHVLEPLIKKEGLWRVYEIDKGIIPIIHRMHANGILINTEYFGYLGEAFSHEKSEILEELTRTTGKDINPLSWQQVSSFLYTDLGLKSTRGGTDKKTLEGLKLKYIENEDVVRKIDLVVNFRELSKLGGTYVEVLPRTVDEHGRVHTKFLLHVTTSGRLSSREPNLQNIPVRSEKGKLIRRGFIASEGKSLVSVDLDQIELRVAAHLSEDENMIEVFNCGKDIHKATASLIYGKDLACVTEQERLLSKTINYGILYCMSPKRLMQELSLLGIRVSLDDCRGFITDWFRSYPGIKDYIQNCHSTAKAVGYVECLFGRRRYLPGVHSTIDKIREESLRWSVNHPDQGTAAGILKLWLRGVWEQVVCKGYGEPILTVHDEVILEVEKGLEEKVVQLVCDEAAKTVELLVPIKAKGSFGHSWDELK